MISCIVQPAWKILYIEDKKRDQSISRIYFRRKNIVFKRYTKFTSRRCIILYCSTSIRVINDYYIIRQNNWYCAMSAFVPTYLNCIVVSLDNNMHNNDVTSNIILSLYIFFSDFQSINKQSLLFEFPEFRGIIVIMAVVYSWEEGSAVRDVACSCTCPFVRLFGKLYYYYKLKAAHVIIDTNRHTINYTQLYIYFTNI